VHGIIWYSTSRNESGGHIVQINRFIWTFFTGESLSTDWDKACSNYRKQGKKNLFSEFNIQKYMEKYVSRDPRPSDYPLSEEVDPLRKSERFSLGFWTNSKFTVVGLGIVVGLLIFYITLFSIR
jgi:hypothetical protein